MKKIILAVMAVCTMTISQAQIEVEGVTMPASVEVPGLDLVLNGAGMREKIVFDLYVGGLYLKAKSTDAKSIINADEDMAFKLHIVSKFVSSKKMISAVDDGFDAAMNGDTSALADKIETFKGFFSDEIVKGNIFDIVYIKEKGSVVYKNGKRIGVVQGLDFKKALFAIWLGADPADDDLKAAMLKG